jgi:hypothetical protein
MHYANRGEDECGRGSITGRAKKSLNQRRSRLKLTCGVDAVTVADVTVAFLEPYDLLWRVSRKLHLRVGKHRLLSIAFEGSAGAINGAGSELRVQ